MAVFEAVGKHEMQHPIALLGPQRIRPSVGAALDDLGIEGSLCAITAGWQEREGEVDELSGHVTRSVVDLAIYHRAERVFGMDPDLAAAYRERQRWLREMQRLYKIRLSHALAAARELLRVRADSVLLERERRAAIAAVRTIDRNHLKRVRSMHEAFERRWDVSRRPSVAAERERLAEIIAHAGAVLIAGGHVAVLLNRLRLFDIGALLRARPLVAWSAGAMVLGSRIVLFHDSPPQGAGDPEVLEQGLGLLSGVLPLPHAQTRLRSDDANRLALFARRFSPERCVTLDAGTRVSFAAGGLVSAQGARQIVASGRLADFSKTAANE